MPKDPLLQPYQIKHLTLKKPDHDSMPTLQSKMRYDC